MKARLTDRLGYSGQLDAIGRMVNDAVQEFASRRKWPFYETEANISFTTNTRDYTLASTVAEVLEVLDSTGLPLSEVNRSEYAELYRGDATTGASPKIWAAIGSPAANTPAIGVWPVPSGNSTGKTRHRRRPAALSADGDLIDVPDDCLWIVASLALSRFGDFEDATENAMKVRAEAERGLAELAALYGLDNPATNPAGMGQ